jgi:hypothetical protein
MLFSHLRLRLPTGLFPSDFRIKILWVFVVYLMRSTCLTYLILLRKFKNIIKSMQSLETVYPRVIFLPWILFEISL